MCFSVIRHGLYYNDVWGVIRLSLESIKSLILGNGGFWIGLLVVVLSLVQISPIKINPWTWIAKKIGKAINGDVIEEMGGLKDEIKDIKQDISDIREEAKEREATNRRTRILEFGDEILHDVDYSKEHWDSILMDISEYEIYCYDHPRYMNNVAKATIKHIKNMYDRHLDEDSFL